jgi:hypothetical protein
VADYASLISDLRGEIVGLKEKLVAGHDETLVVTRRQLPPDGGQQGGGPPGGPPGSSQEAGIEAGAQVHRPRPPALTAEQQRRRRQRRAEEQQRISSARDSMLSNVRQRMQLKQSMLELEDQNVQNDIDLSRLQLQMVEYEHRMQVVLRTGRLLSQRLC